MKKVYILILFLFSLSTLSAQKTKSRGKQIKSGFITCSEFHITKPLREIFAEHPVDENKNYQGKESEDREHRTPQKFPFTVKDGPQFGNAPASIQTRMGNVSGRAPITNWAGQTASGFRPFDPSGASGPNNYVQMINSTTFKVYTKSTGAVTLTGTLGNLWSPVTANAGDPIVLYDKAADRWFLAQFGSSTDKKIYIAISMTSDPAGSYYTYTFVSPEFPDYLKFSVWSDGYYMTSNQTQKVFAFERIAMLAGNAASRAVYTGFTPPEGTGFFVPLPGDASDGTLPTAGTPCPIFSYSDNGWGTGYSDAVNIYQMSVNWVPSTPTGTITLSGNIPTAAFDASYNASWNDVSQPGTTQKLDGIGGVCMYRAQWKTWSGYNTVVLNWAVKISTSQRSIKWCELRQNQSTGVWSMYQEGIYSPDAATRWMGSIAMDKDGSIALCYMKTDATNTIYPGLYFTGRRICDPLGTLPVTETTAIVGTGSQTGVNRDGDYGQLVLDPDGSTFWYTGEYMGGATGGSASRTRIFSFQLAGCSNTASVTISQTTGANPQCAGASATFTATPVNGGTTPIYQWQVNGFNVGTNSPTYTTTTLSSGQIVTCIMTSNLSGVVGSPSTSNSITMIVNSLLTPAVSIALSTGSNPSCSGTSLTFTATPLNGGSTPSYQWKVNGVNAGTNNSTFTTSSLTNGQIVSCVLTSNYGCVTSTTATSNSITITINTNGTPSLNITSGSNTICAGGSVTFTATPTNGGVSPAYQWQVNGINTGTNNDTFITSALTNGQVVTCVLTSNVSCPVSATLGTGTGTNTTTSGLGASYPTYWGNGRQQYLIKASELTALGLSAGNLTSIGFNIAGTIGDPATLIGYTIKIAATSTTVLNGTFQATTFTTVYGPVNYTPVISSVNTHTFSSPFTWNGSSNILVDLCFSNQVVGVTAYQSYQTSTSFVSTTYYQADNATGAGACTQTTGTASGSIRPNMIFTDATAITATSNGITMTVNPNVTADVSIAAVPSGAICSGTSVTFTASPVNGGSTPVYQWKKNGVNAGTNSTTYTDAGLTTGNSITCVMTSNAACVIGSPDTSNAIVISVNPNVTADVSIAAVPSGAICSGTSVTFTASPVNGGSTPVYQWKKNGVNAGTNSTTYTDAGLTTGNSITCVMTSNAACVIGSPDTSNAIVMTVNPNVTAVVSIAAVPSGAICSGTSVTFTATPSNGGSTPLYQWKKNGVNVGTNSTTYTDAGLTTGNSITCVMTSNATCVNGSQTTSNAIVMSVNPNVTADVSIAPEPSGAICSGTSVTFTASPVNGGSTPVYQWKKNGVNAGTNSTTYTDAGLSNGNSITCVMTSNAVCINGSPDTSNTIVMSVSPIVTANVSIAPVPSGAICSGTSVTFTATPSNGGTVPVYKWKKNGLAVGSNSATYSDNVFINGDQVICEMTSSEACVIPQGATTSNSIVLTVIGCSSVTLNLKVYIEGFYKGNGLMNAVIDSANYPNICDTISVELHNTVSPYNSVEWKRGTISTSGNGSFIFSSSVTGNAYYIVIRQRNGLATWSRNAVLFNNSTVNFDFTRQ